MTSLKSLQSGSPEYRKRIQKCIDAIREGSDFPEAVEISELFPRRFQMQIKSGDETGSLAKMFRHLSSVLDESITLRVAQLVQLLEEF